MISNAGLCDIFQPVSMSFGDFFPFAIHFVHDALFAFKNCCPLSTSHRPAHNSLGRHYKSCQNVRRCYRVVFGHRDDNRSGRFRVKFGRVCVCHAEHVSAEFDDGQLHAETNAEIRLLVRPTPIDRCDFPLYSAITESAGNNCAVRAA